MSPHHLRQIRKRLRLTQVQFAELVGVAPNTIARWERGELRMRKTVANLIERINQDADLTAKGGKR
jgi:DNA-binding transcriptional regulator YiaG